MDSASRLLASPKHSVENTHPGVANHRDVRTAGKKQSCRKEAIGVESFTITIRTKAGAHWPIVVELSGAKTPLPIRREGMLELDLEALWTQVTPRYYWTIMGQVPLPCC